MKSLAALLLLYAAPAVAQGVVVSEILASNDATLEEPDVGRFSDWIELHNRSTEAVDLGGHFLTDDLGDPKAWRIPDGTVLAPGAFLLVWADDEDIAPPVAENLHASFQLSADGEAVGLFGPGGVLVDSVTFGPQTTNVSYGRVPGTGEWALFPEPTPGAANTTPPGVTFAPTLSLPSGFYDGPVSLAMDVSQADATVRYTLDGSPPTEDSPVYTGPLALDENTVVRAAAFADARVPSEVVSRVYVVGEASTLPVVSLVTDPDGFFSDEHGIYVDGANGVRNHCTNGPVNWNQDWEREALVSIFEPDGAGGLSLAMEQRAGVQVFGGCSRRFDQKSLSLHARGRYGASAFEHRLFPDLELESFDDLVLRNSGSDWSRTMFRDAAIQTITRHMDLDGQAYRPMLLFLNGEYWGIHNLREKLNEDYVAAHYDLDDDDVEMVEGMKSGQSEHFDGLLRLVEADLNDPETWAEVTARMDVDQFMDYQIAQIYVANGDWPGNNVKLWRPRQPDGRWRWMLYDLDHGYASRSTTLAHRNMLAAATATDGPDWPNPPWSTFLFRRLLTHDGFRHAFIQRLAAHTATTFDPARTIRVIDSLQAGIAVEIPRHSARWPNSLSRGESWEQQVQVMREFAEQRPAHVREHVASHFDEVTGSARLAVGVVGGGEIRAEGVRLPRASPEDPFGVEFYQGVPVQLVALPDEGYVFAGWSGLNNADADTIAVTLTGPGALTATFAPDATLGEISLEPRPGRSSPNARTATEEE